MPLSDADLEQLLYDLESDRVERKTAFSDPDKVRQAVCAFANDLPNHRLPGVIFIGVNDNGSFVNAPVTDALLLSLSSMKDTGNILPLPSLIVQKRIIRGNEIAVVIVEPSDAPPVRYSGRVWVRVGPRRALATPEEERRLAEKRRARDLPFDLRPVPSASLADMNMDLFRQGYLPLALAPDVIAQNQRTTEDQLASLRFITPTPEFCPTVLGVLTFGIEPRNFVPGSYIQFLRIDGVDWTDPIRDQKEISGPVPELLRNLDTVIEAHVSVALDVTSGRLEVRRPDYPLVALQQLARNAVLHRTYEGTNAPVRITWFNDRIEIQSPGGPFGQVNRGNFGIPGVTDYRNPHLAEVMKNLGYVQRFGLGISLAKDALSKNSNPPVEFFVEEAHILAVIRRHP